jgi:SAM-dependent methyltransferase
MPKRLLKKILINLKVFLGKLTKENKCLLCGSSRDVSLLFKGWPYYYLKCNSCNLTFIGNRPSRARYRGYVQRGHLSSFRVEHKKDWPAWQEWKVITYRNLGFSLLENSGPEPKRILEIGCGEGRQLEIFQQRQWEALGIDPNKNYCQQSEALGLKVINAYIEDVELPAADFDLVIATHVLEHLRDPRILVEKAFRFLKKGGRLILEIPLTLEYDAPEHLFIFSEDSLDKLLSERGFTIIKGFKYQDRLYQMDNLALIAAKNKE